jgi:hypothetical protein
MGWCRQHRGTGTSSTRTAATPRCRSRHRAIRQLVAFALDRHERVHLIIAEGNHDESGSVWLRQMFSALYEGEPRASVDTSALPFYTFLWGDTFLGFHHGHKVKNEALPMLFAAQFREQWGGPLALTSIADTGTIATRRNTTARP